MSELTIKVYDSFDILDSLHRRGGLNMQQFYQLLEKDLNLNFE